MLQLPLQWAALLQGENPKSFITKVTGISKSRIARGSFDELRQSTIQRAERDSLDLACKQATDSGWSPHDFASTIETQPKLASGATAQLGALFHFWSKGDGIALDATITSAVQLEESVTHIQFLAGQGHRAKLRDAVFDLAKQLNEASTSVDVIDINSLGDTFLVFERCLMGMYENIFATLDVEWGAQYFPRLRAQAIFPFVSPLVDLSVGDVRIGRNWLRRPTRRLLEVTHAIAYRGHSGRWPAKPAGRSEVGKILELSDSGAGNYFDDTRKLTFRGFETWWLKLTASMRRDFGETRQMASPAMLARVALLWQHCWLKTDATKIRAVVLLDEHSYRERWTTIRERQPATRPDGLGEWPSWLSD